MIETKKFYEDLPDYKAYQVQIKRLQSGEHDIHTIAKTDLYATLTFEDMEAEIKRLQYLIAFHQYASKMITESLSRFEVCEDKKG